MSSRDALAMARDKDIPIVREGLVSVDKHFDPNAITKYLDSAHLFYYRTELRGEPARTTLIFTAESKFLSTVQLRRGGVANNDGFGQFVFEMLQNKYGSSVKKKKQIFFETLFWTIDKTNRVSMRTGSNQILVEYLDLTVDTAGENELRARKEQYRRDAKAHAAGKF